MNPATPNGVGGTRLERPPPHPPPPPPRDDPPDLGRALGELTSGGRPSRGQMSDFIGASGRSAREAGLKRVASGEWLGETVQAAAGHLRFRDLKTLVEHHHGLTGPLLAEDLIRNASLVSAAVGALTGGMAAAEELSPTTWVTLPFELLAETLVVVAIEMKLVAELHAVAGRPIEGTASQVGLAVTRAWADTRGVAPTDLLAAGGTDVLGRQTRRQLTAHLRRRLLARTGRSLGSFAPFLIGAGVGAELNRRASRTVGREVAKALAIPIRR